MKKLLYILLISGIVFSFQSCNDDEDILPVQEYVAIQPKSFKFETVTEDDDVVAFEFKLTNFEPQSYTILRLSVNEDMWITGSTPISEVDISGEEPVATITGTLPKSEVFSGNTAGETAFLRLTLTSAAGNTAVAEPWLTVTLAEGELALPLGTWTGSVEGAPATIVINEDGSGTLSIPLLFGDTPVPVTWSVSGDKLTISSQVEGVGGTYTFSYTDDGKLVLAGLGEFTPAG